MICFALARLASCSLLVEPLGTSENALGYDSNVWNAFMCLVMTAASQ